MKIKFEDNLDFQQEAIASITGIFEGQEICRTNFTVARPKEELALMSDLGIGNKLTLLEDEILENVQKIQLHNGVKQSVKLGSYDFSVEMETGTGKTYVYLRTIFELNKKYGFTKFIIVVPSIAIKEGTNKSLEITKEHFKGLYDNVSYDFFTYDSSKLEQVRSFATNDYIQIMVINIDAFRKSFTDPSKETKANIIHRTNDKLSGYRPIDFIKDTNPIVIIDEPQSVDTTPKAKEAIASLNPLCTLRYSATHKNRYNLMYKLDSVDAYDRKLVKQIEVASFDVEGYQNQAYIRLVKTDNKNGYRAQIEVDVNKGGKVDRVKKWVKQGDDLYELTRRELYDGYIIKDIYFREGEEYIDFTSRPDIVRLGHAIGTVDDDEIKRLQIRKTIEEHLNKELLLNPKKIKVLSLFFIDRVANYRDYDGEGNPRKGKFARIFEEEYLRLAKSPKYHTLFEGIRDLDAEVEDIHNGYFSIDKRSKASNKKDKFEAFTDTSGATAKDEDTFNLIMKDKEKLLSFDSKLRFIFSHSALKEGWDNPNVFQICTLNETSSETKKRQEIGRGLRICVNQDGERVHGFEVNTLTVMANESYEEFVKKLQKEIEADTGIRFGVVEEHTFANLVTGMDGEKAVYLGSKSSEQLWDFFKGLGYINERGKVQDKLRIAIRDHKVEIPYEFKEVRGQVVNLLKRIAGNLNVKDASKKQRVTLNKRVLLSPEFQELWDKIKYKTTFSVQFDSEELIQKCAQAINEQLFIASGKMIFRKGKAEITKGGVSIKEETDIAYNISSIAHDLPDIISYIQNETNLTRKSIVEILVQSKRLDLFKKNPQRFIDGVIDIIRTQMRHFIVDGIKYQKIGEEYYFTQELFENEELYGHLQQNMIKSERSPFTFTVYDSDVEKEFAQRMEQAGEVKVYAKLPNWFRIETPLGDYNPDWAVLWEQNGDQKLFFIVETKGALSWEFLRATEKGKIECGKKHFAAIGENVRLEVADSLDSLRDRV